MERDIDRIHQESETRIEDLEAENQKYIVYKNGTQAKEKSVNNLFLVDDNSGLIL